MYIALYARQSIDNENSISIETQLQYCDSMIRPDERQYKIKNLLIRDIHAKIPTDLIFKLL